jgi:hypothetical protein
MLRLTIPAILVTTIVLFSIPGHRPTAEGCAVAPRAGQHVDIAEESAIIIWDSATKTEHFIRRAAFKTEAKDFGFLVPTPSKPTLAEADDSAFGELERITAPPIRAQTQTSSGCIGCSATKSMAPGAASEVSVLHEQRVAGYDAVVLAATDAVALNKWLADHGYQSSDVLKKWLEPYVAKGWIITAFKIASPSEKVKDGKGASATKTTVDGKATPSPASTAGVATSAVRMTFTTDRPFYPYREPEDQRGPNASKERRLLRVYFIGTERVEGTVGDETAFAGQTKWSKVLPDAERQSLLSILKLNNEKTPATWRLTEFEDRSSPRPGTDDLFFRAAKDQNNVERTAITYPSSSAPPAWPFFVLCLLIVAAMYLRRALRPRPAVWWGTV